MFNKSFWAHFAVGVLFVISGYRGVFYETITTSGVKIYGSYAVFAGSVYLLLSMPLLALPFISKKQKSKNQRFIEWLGLIILYNIITLSFSYIS